MALFIRPGQLLEPLAAPRIYNHALPVTTEQEIMGGRQEREKTAQHGRGFRSFASRQALGTLDGAQCETSAFTFGA